MGVIPFFSLYSKENSSKSSIFILYSNQRFAKDVVYSNLALVLTKALQQSLFFYNFALILPKALLQILFYCIFALILTQALPLRAFFSIFTTILTKALPNRVFVFLFLPLFKKGCQKGFLYFCPKTQTLIINHAHLQRKYGTK